MPRILLISTSFRQDGQVLTGSFCSCSGVTPADFRPLSTWAYFGYQLLFSLPFVGFVCLLIFSFGGTHNRNLRNFARSYFCMFIIVVLLILILAAIGGFAYFYSY